MTRILFLLVFLLICNLGLQAQSSSKVVSAMSFIEKKADKWNLETADYKDALVSDMYTTKEGNTFIYLNQAINGIPIYNAITSVVVRHDGKVFNAGSRFIPSANKKVTKGNANVDPATAIIKAAEHLHIRPTSIPQLLRSNDDKTFDFGPVDFVHNEITVYKVYYLEGEDLKLAYSLDLDVKESINYMNIIVDALSGDVLFDHNYAVSCQVSSHDYKRHTNCGAHKEAKKESKKSSASTMMGATYNIFPFPTESPIHGSQELVVDPQLLDASPFGWHDIDGVEGAEYTITRGNNVHAFNDRDDDGFSDLDEPDGGEDLVFDFAHGDDIEPEDNSGLSQSNLFYAVNMLHDYTYRLGFTEETGNFQENNYGNGGLAGDPVIAQSLDGIDAAIPKLNNANFLTPRDGTNGFMQMFLWEKQSGSVFVTEPAEISGFFTSFGTADFGSGIPFGTTPAIEGNVTLAEDGSPQNSTDACQEIINDVEGTIVMVDRGLCNFSDKVRRAQDKGAIAVLICNIAGAGGDGEEISNMTGENTTDITIPSIMLPKSNCDLMKATLLSGITVSMSLKEREATGAEYLDGALDNGIIAHEFGHGVSNRLVGGGSNVSCLSSDEQAGEGIGDFLALMFTNTEDDSRDDAVGIGNYATDGGVNGRGIRSYPYSTDMNINPQVYDDLAIVDVTALNLQYQVGTVWTAILWEVYWNFVDEFGLDTSWDDEESGNFKAGKLIITGMATAPCNPSFVEMRDAILTADSLFYDGENGELLWTAFAKRGLGYKADDGNPNDVTDNTPNYEVFPLVIQKLKISKEMPTVVQPGQEIDVVLNIANHVQETKDQLMVTDQIPEGMTYVAGSSSIPSNLDGDNLTFALDNVAYKDEFAITYKLLVDAENDSQTLYFEDLENFDDSDWEREFLEEFYGWVIYEDGGKSGDVAWYSENLEIEIDQTIIMPELTIAGEKPILRFWHKFDTERGNDGGFLEISTDGKNTWNALKDEFIRNGYNGGINYSTFAIPSLSGFSGNSEDYIDSYVDLSSYVGETVNVRFRFGTNETIAPTSENPGWFVDDIELIDLESAGTVACVESVDDEDEEIVCTESLQILYDTQGEPNSVNELDLVNNLKIYPNPASQVVSISMESDSRESAVLSITSIDGKVVRTQNIQLTGGKQVRSFNVSDLTSGIYIVELRSETGVSTTRLIKN